MKLKTLLLALCLAGFAVSVAVAASPATPAEGTPTTAEQARGGKAKGRLAHAPACKPARKLVLRGEFVSGDAAGFALAVTGGNRAAKAWRGKQATVLVDGKTRVHGAKKALGALAAGDRLHVQGFACKADAAAGTVLARKVGVKGAKGAADDEGTATTAQTETTVTTTGS